jgi:hypothetical protein
MDCAFADGETSCYLAIRQAGSHHAHDLELPGRQQAQTAMTGSAGPERLFNMRLKYSKQEDLTLGEISPGAVSTNS